MKELLNSCRCAYPIDALSSAPHPFPPHDLHRHIPRNLSGAAARIRELEGETQRLGVSLLAREQDILVSDREMHAMSTRLKQELQQRTEAAASAEAVAAECRGALEAAVKAGVDTDGNDGDTDGSIGG